MSFALPARIVLSAALLALAPGCGQSSGKQNQAAYDACLKAAKANAKLAKAEFAKFEDVTIGASTGEEEIRINIPYQLEGTKALHQCIAQKQADGTFKVVF
ncbi:MAG: hypothetical protein ACREIP_02010 [Alphaproteobacteria bacterium]